MYLSKIIGYLVFISEGWIANGPIGNGTVHPPKVNKSVPLCEQYLCKTCGRMHDKVWFYRPSKTSQFGNFMAVRVGRDWHVPDGSLPCNVERVPKSAWPLSEDTMSALWHDSSGSHDFTGAQYERVHAEISTVEARKIMNRYRRTPRY